MIDIFHLPIEYISNNEINKTIINELELNNDKQSLYSLIFNTDNEISKLNIDKWCKYYTTNKKFLKDSQKIINNNVQYNIDISDDILDICNDLNNEKSFNQKYNYVNYSLLDFINNNSKFLQLLTVYDICSPIISLTIPILILIIPFIILKFKGNNINISNYVNVLKVVFKNHTIGKLFSFDSKDLSKNMYILFSLMIFIIQNYNNVNSCLKIYENFKLMHHKILTLKTYINNTIDIMDKYEKNCKKYKTYIPFINDMNNYKYILSNMIPYFNHITDFKFSFNKMFELGDIKLLFYKLYNDDEYKNALSYSLHFNGYIMNMNNIQKRFKNNQLNKCSFSKKTSFKGAYYPFLINKNPITNKYILDKNIILTGPNASGKTTLLKTTILNIIFSQQFGIGFYTKANIKLYDYIHCYINIPDTSDRDSLFQAEARRCKNILNKIQKSNKKHFCVFDELFSGTNHYEAISTATSFLNYINQYNNTDYIITTHYIDLCNKINNKSINYHMNVNEKSEYTYKLKKGISNIKGGVKILKDMNFPKEIILNSEKIFNSI